ncbi:serine hydrolase domain-containing protein [Lactobacillus sp. ESL0681]|uniref:serine hydrolase domain-containing protein n=1 Tax=Lactobacillus sp. ESL0681 TaxID=2983211 RepID=UPI0023F8759F|nr:serine hydrolase domain-containing protein [Lactobacillus sp. ESL0681]WEV39851.1 serine hydrolase [Lactobacillus sp. ESL0681]
MRQQIAVLGIKGSVLVLRNGKTLLNYATENTTDTSYLINSVQKSMTAAMVMHEVQAGKLSLHDRLDKFLPDVPGAKKVTIKHLLTMTAGLEIEPGAKLGSEYFITDEDNLQRDIAKTIFKPQMLGQWYYSSLNYVYLCAVMSKVTHKSYEQLFNQLYIKPLGLKQTAFLWANPEQLQASGLAMGMQYHRGQYVPIRRKQALRDAHNELGAGSIVMSNHDIVKTLHYILAGKLLSAKSRKQLYHSQPPYYYGGGFYNDDQLKLKTANGAGAGYYTFMRSTNDAQTMIIIQSNRTRHGQFDRLKPEIDALMWQLLDIKPSNENITG